MQSIHKTLLSIVLTTCVCLILSGCGRLAIAVGPLLYDVSVAPALITPNADGDQDVTDIRYSLRRPATVSIYVEDHAGARYFFREKQRRAAGEYRVQWGGTIDDPTVVETEYGRQEILSRVLPDGAYRWTVAASDDTGATEAISGEITLQDSDATVPQLNSFTVAPTTFTPNQDSIDDRVSISYYLTKDVETMQVYLADPEQPGVRFFIPPKPGVADPTERGYHDHDYDGGVDLNAEPPPDGTYTVVAEAQDRAGNAVRVTQELTIREGGKPRADVKQGEIEWEGEMNRVVSVPLGETLCFTAYVTNEGTVPIRTTGPWPGQEYQFSENYNTLAAREDDSWYQQAGVWRFGINYDTTGIDFPFRWAVGRKEDLEMRVIDGDEQWYLLPGATGEVNGCIVMDQEPPVGTTFWHGGLIHEFVEIANNNIDRITVNVGVP